MSNRNLLLARRIPRADIIIGRAYLIHARHGGVGVAITEAWESGRTLGYQIRREKCGRYFLDIETDWADSETHGTVIPLALLDDRPPTDVTELLAWLRKQETEHQSETETVWKEVLKK